MATEVAELIFEADTSALVAANDRLERLNVTGVKTEKVAKATTGSFRVMKGATQQLGFQIQDIAVQLAGGQNAMVVFGQQGSQIASIFGPGGAVVGALLAVGAAIGTAFLPKLLDSKSATDQLEESLKNLTDTIKVTKDGTILLSEEFEILATKTRDIAEVQLRARLLDATAATTAALKAMREETEFLGNVLEKTGGNARGNENRLNRLAESLGITSSETRELIRLQEQAFSTNSQEDIAAFQKRVSELAISSEGATDKFVNFAQAVNTAFLDLKEGESITEQLKVALDDLDTALATSGEKTTERIKKQADDRAKELERIYEDEERLTEFFARETEKREELERKSAERRVAINLATSQAVLSAQTDFFTQLGGILQQGNDDNSAAAKVGYAITQAVQVAQAINNANLAYSGIVAASAQVPDPTGATLAAGIARAEVIRGLGYATAGLIAGNAVGTIAGRAQGGQVRPGQAYRVGEFGPETLVMGSNGGTVTNAANDGVNMNLVTNVKVIGGGDAKVTNTTTQAGDRKFVQDIVVDLMANQSSPARNALHKTSNVKPLGQR